MLIFQIIVSAIRVMVVALLNIISKGHIRAKNYDAVEIWIYVIIILIIVIINIFDI